jgi:DNA invertase Pin-like site-specific DNA recombinase
MKKIGYARISTHEQNLDLQYDALNKAECFRIFTDTMSGAKADRPGLSEALNYLREGDTLVVWRLDRLGRSLKDLLELVNALQSQGIGFCSLQENIDTTTSGGKLIFHIFASLAEFERSIIRERTLAGLTAARARGRRGGRPMSLDDKQLKLVREMYADLKKSPQDICETFHISRSALYRYVARNDIGELSAQI